MQKLVILLIWMLKISSRELVFNTDTLFIKNKESFDSKYSISQRECLDSVACETDTFGDGKEKYLWPLIFTIQNDSLRISTKEKNILIGDINLQFVITEKHCVWNKAYSDGQSTYHLVSVGGSNVTKPILSILIKNNQGQINLQYPDQEPRIFNIINVKASH